MLKKTQKLNNKNSNLKAQLGHAASSTGVWSRRALLSISAAQLTAGQVASFHLNFSFTFKISALF
jgi:hypothetical protein